MSINKNMSGIFDLHTQNDKYEKCNPMSYLVSVIIPTYNRSELLTRAADSVLQQTYKNLELIIVDDNSSDNTQSVASEIQQSDSRVKIVTNKNNMQNAARNSGLARASGEVIAFLDDDDVWLKQKLEYQLRHVDTYSIVGCLSQHNDGAPPQPYNNQVFEVSLNDFYWSNIGFSPSKFICRRDKIDSIEGFDPNLPGATGIDFTANLLYKYGPGAVVKSPLVIHFTNHSFQRVSTTDIWLTGCYRELKKNWNLRSAAQRRFRQVQLKLIDANREPRVLRKLRLIISSFRFIDPMHPLKHAKLFANFIIFRFFGKN